jgi:choline kinase
LLRIYGPSSGALISRPRELRTLHILSSQYRIGPRVWGTFLNGRIEEFFESETLTAASLRDPATSRWIGMRMAELHSVDMDVIEDISHPAEGEGKTWDIAARENVREWLTPAKEVLAMPCIPPTLSKEFDLDSFLESWAQYLQWLQVFEARAGRSARVFSHNDARYDNLLRVTRSDKAAPSGHRQVAHMLLCPCQNSHVRF